ncbi:hypothetical protein B0H14DRAFT_2622911 [Mycena olivaceomarginata]|nr:hypothetical protein B0H14DRAFT_2622911 [Mycena olivaceomarginata]
MSSPSERLYTPKDLEGKTKNELSKIIQGQFSKWPEDTFNLSKIRRETLVKGILANGFSLRVETDASAGENAGPSVPTPEVDADKDSPEPSTAPTQLRSLDLLIEDLRDQPASKFIQDIQVESEADLETGEWLVNTKEITVVFKRGRMEALLCQNLGDRKLEDGKTSVQLKIPSSSRLKIFVEASEASLNIRKRERSDSETDVLQSHSKLDAAGPSRKRTSNPDAADVAWLQNLLSERQGYAVFKKNQNKKLSNKDRVLFWDFAANFSAQYFNKPSAAPGGLGKSIKKVSIEVALGMSPSALREAEKMTSILEIFGEGGIKHAQEVFFESGSRHS